MTKSSIVDDPSNGTEGQTDRRMFFHAFPRCEVGCEAELGLGLQVLESILSYGLLLTSEKLHIPPNPLSDRPFPPTTQITQYRACFTLAQRSEVTCYGPHCRLFGRFAIGLDTHRARQLGIVPTIYYYRGYDTAGSVAQNVDSGLSEEILYRLSEIRQVLIALALVEAKGRSDRDRFKSTEYLRMCGMELCNETVVERTIERLTPEECKKVANIFDTDRVAAWNEVEWLEIVMSMFQTTDSRKTRRHLAYYAQREWRIVQSYVCGLVCLPLAEDNLSRMPVELEQHVHRTREARDRIAAMGSLGKMAYVSDSFLLSRYGRSHFREFIEEIVAPRRCSAEAEEIIERYFRRVRKDDGASTDVSTVFSVGDPRG